MDTDEYIVYDNKEFKKTYENGYILLKRYDTELKTNITLKFKEKNDEGRLEEVQNNIEDAINFKLNNQKCV